MTEFIFYDYTVSVAEFKMLYPSETPSKNITATKFIFMRSDIITFVVVSLLIVILLRFVLFVYIVLIIYI